MADRKPHFEVFPEKNPAPLDHVLTGKFVWHFQDANGRITFTGATRFTRREDAHRSIGGVGDALDALALPPIVDLDENGVVIGRG